MTQVLEQIRQETALAVRAALKGLQAATAGSRLFGFALCTDDDSSTLYHVACRADWASEQEAGYPGVGYIAVEWTLSVDPDPLRPVGELLASLAGRPGASDEERSAEADLRFEALVLALGDCREAGDFLPDTFLCVESTDPSEHLEGLAVHGVARLNPPGVAERYAAALGREKWIVK